MQLSVSYFISCFVSNNLQLLTSLCNSPPFHQVAQYIKFEMPVLQSFITKLKEEEDREVQKLRKRYKKQIIHHCVLFLCFHKGTLIQELPCYYEYYL